MSAPGVFVTGTDTGVGKTWVSCALLRRLGSLGWRAVGMKPVLTGIASDAPTDAMLLRDASRVSVPMDWTNPYAFAPPIAPHVAARDAGVTIDLERIATAHEALAQASEFVVVEGAGGPLVPLGSGADMLDIATRLRVPVLLVVGVRLGCISHALLAALAIRARGLELCGWVANHVDPGMLRSGETVATIERALAAPRLATFAAGEREWRGDLPFRRAAR